MRLEILKTFLLLFAVGVVISCKVGRDYKQPELMLPSAYRFVVTADTSSVADLRWNVFFKDTNLLKLIDRGITNNYDRQIALKRLEEGRIRFRQARLLQLPEFSLQVTAQSMNPSNNSLNGISLKSFLGKTHLEDYSAGVVMAWEADIWGKLRRQQESAGASYLASVEAMRAIQTQLVADIAQGYYNLLMLDAQLNVARRNLQLADSTLQFTRLQRNAGEVTSLAVQQAQVLSQSMALLIPQLEQNVAIQENALSVLLGANPDAIRRTTQLAAAELPVQPAAGLPAGVVSRRPDVRAREFQLVAANARVGVAQSYMYPSLNILASGGVNSFVASNWFSIPASLFGTVAGGLTQPLFQRGRIKAEIQSAEITREQSVLEFRKAVLVAVAEVSDALVRQEKLATQYSIASAQVDTLQGAIRNARLLFRSGMANYLEVITAQTNILQAELNLASIKRQQLSASIELYRALGGGWN